MDLWVVLTLFEVDGLIRFVIFGLILCFNFFGIWVFLVEKLFKFALKLVLLSLVNSFYGFFG